MYFLLSLFTDVSWNLQPVLNATSVLVGLETVGCTTDSGYSANVLQFTVPCIDCTNY